MELLIVLLCFNSKLTANNINILNYIYVQMDTDNDFIL